MSWKDNGSGGWTWVDDGSGDPSNPPAGQPPSANQTATRSLNTAPRTITPSQVSTAPQAVTTPATPQPAGASYPSTPVIYDPTTGQTSNGATTSTGQTVKTFDPNDPSTYTTRTNSDGSTSYLDLRGIEVQRSAPPTGAPGSHPDATPTGLPPTVSGISGQAVKPDLQVTADGYFDPNTGKTYRWGIDQMPVGRTFQGADGKMWAIDANGNPVATGIFAGSPNPTGNANQNASDVLTRVNDQTSQDIARISAGGAEAQNTIKAAAGQATNTGNQLYGDALTARLEALARGDAGLTTAETQGNEAISTGNAVAQPLYGLGNEDAGNAIASRNTAASETAAAGQSLSSADAMVQRLQQLAAAGDPSAVTALKTFQGSAGTAPALASFNPTATRTDNFQASTGDAAALENLPTGTSATNELLGFQGTSATADQLAKTPTKVSSTQDLLDFEGNRGTADALAGLNTSVDTSPLASFTPGGQSLVDRLTQIANGGDIGPSVAEAQLRQQAQKNMASALSLARSGRGVGANASALRQAIFQNAATNQDTNEAAAVVRATEAATQREQNIGAASAAGNIATTQSGQQLTAAQSTVAARTQAVADRISALTQSGAMTQKQADQMLTALQSGQQGQLQSVASQIEALKASGALSEEQSSQLLDAVKSAQQGQTAAVAQQSTNIATAGAQRQTASGQTLQALTAQQQADIANSKTKLDALVASGQMTQKQADEQLAALQSAAQGQTTSEATRVQAATAAGSTANTSAGVSADLAKAFATLGLQYDVNTGNVYDQAGQLVQGGDKLAADLLQTGLTNQVGQGQVATTASGQGTQALTALTNTSVEAQKAAGVLGFQTASSIASLSQGELAQIQQIVQAHDNLALQQYLGDRGIAIQVDQANAQQTGSVIGAIGTIAAGAALMLSDVRAKTDVEPDAMSNWFAMQGLNTPPAKPGTGAPTTADSGMSLKEKLGMVSSLGSAFGQLGYGIASDERGKTDKRESRIDELLDKLDRLINEKPEPERSFDDLLFNARPAKGYSYRYKDPRAPGAAPGKQFGPMAQDMLKSGPGVASAVHRGPNGMLAVDPDRAALAAVAGLSEEQRRNDAQDKMLKRLLQLAEGRA